MKIVINIDEKDYKRIKEIPETFDSLTSRTYKVIKDGTPLPEHHGRLIDADELLDWSYQIDSMYCVYDEVVNVDDIKNAPTVIEGSESE